MDDGKLSANSLKDALLQINPKLIHALGFTSFNGAPLIFTDQFAIILALKGIFYKDSLADILT